MNVRHLIVASLVVFAGCRQAVPNADSGQSLQYVGGYRGPFNNDDQSHADLCVRLRTASAALRYVDGTPTGFYIDAPMLQPQAGNGVSCPEKGMARLDARELVRLADGRTMLFHRGGWGFVGDDPASAVHFGHLLTSDVDTAGLKYVRADSAHSTARWIPAPTTPWSGLGQEHGNGTACSARSAAPFRIAVRAIPSDMRYLNSAQTNAVAYAIYGDPSEDLGPPADRARGIKYSMLTWSWINVRGGGVARALLRDGDAFYPCTDVPPIRLASVTDAATKTPSGSVTAIYGAVRAGNGDWLYGWAVSTHKHRDEPDIPHMVR
jgi:hypothetical protein